MSNNDDVNLMMLAAHLRGERPPVQSDGSWANLEALSLRQGVAPLLYWQCQQNDVSLPDAVGQRLQRAFYANGLQNKLARAALGEALDCLEAVGVQAVVLKGAALAFDLYPDPALRPMVDLDLLIRPQELSRARVALIAAGYSSAQNEPRPHFIRDFGGQLPFARTCSTGADRIELHWHLIDAPYYYRHLQSDWFWERTEIARLGPCSARMLNPTALLLHLASHVSLHHAVAPRLIWFYDLALLLKQRRDRLDCDELLAAARTFKLGFPLRMALEYTLHLFGSVVPADARVVLAELQPDLTERRLFKMLTWRPPVPAFLVDLVTMSGWRRRLRFVWGNLLPSATYMHQRYGTGLWRAYLIRFRLGIGNLWRELLGAMSRSFGINQN